MAAILVIEDDQNLQGLIEKIFPQNKFRFLEKYSDDPASLSASPGGLLRGDPMLALERIVREVLKSKMVTGNTGHIHESIIGKVEKTLIATILEEEHGNQLRTAKRLGMNRATLRKRMKDLHIVTKIVTKIVTG